MAQAPMERTAQRFTLQALACEALKDANLLGLAPQIKAPVQTENTHCAPCA